MAVRKFIASIFFTLLTLTTTFGQGKENKTYALSKIKKLYQQINGYKNYKTVTIENSEEFIGETTDNGGSLKGYYKGDSLKKIIEWVGLSNRVVQNEYYFNKGELVFVYSTEKKYRFNESTQSFDYSKLDNAFNGRYYFDKEKLIDTIFSDKEHNETKQQDALALLTSSKNYLKLLNSKRP
jgi:hypothetical protein